MHFLQEVEDAPFIPPPPVSSIAIEETIASGFSLSIGDLGASVVGTGKARVSRTERYAQGPFIKLGKHARVPFMGSASPDIWNAAAAVATMAASHCLAGIPRNGLLSEASRQADFAKEVFSWLDQMEEEVLAKRTDRAEVAKAWRRNVMGTVEANPVKAVERAKLLYKSGVRAFRIYSPEPGTGTVETVAALRSALGPRVELFAGQIIDIPQAKSAQKAGADGLIVGIGGGGRCITGVRSGSVIDWPLIVWRLRGEVTIPVIVEGGASDYVSTTFLLGASGISLSRAVAGGTIESPGGALYCVDSKGKMFKPYGGEASARTKYLDGKLLPFDIPSFVEGETTRAEMGYLKHHLPTLTYNLHYFNEDAVLALVFRNCDSITELQSINPSPLLRSTSFDLFQRSTH